jgi:hypothetical protein
MSELLADKVRHQLASYEHPLFDFEARSAEGGVEVEIRYKPVNAAVHNYTFKLQPREIEHAQFPWTFQKQLYDCLHDYIIEMFTRNPQRVN